METELTTFSLKTALAIKLIQIRGVNIKMIKVIRV